MECLRQLLGLLEQFGVSESWANVEKKRLRIKYETDNSQGHCFEELIEDIVYLIK